MPVVETGQDNTADQGAIDEQAKFDAARAELYDEATGGNSSQSRNQEGEDLILGKYKSQQDLVDAYKNLQRENERLRGGEEPEEPEASYEPDNDNDQEQSISPEEAAAIRDSVFAGRWSREAAVIAGLGQPKPWRRSHQHVQLNAWHRGSGSDPCSGEGHSI